MGQGEAGRQLAADLLGDASELGRSLLTNNQRARSDAHADPPMHVI